MYSSRSKEGVVLPHTKVVNNLIFWGFDFQNWMYGNFCLTVEGKIKA